MYLGNDLQVAFPSYRNIDDISSAFNGVTTSFPLLINGSAPVPAPLGSNQCLISVNGVVQKPDDTGATGFRLSGGNIIFSSAPAGAATFFGVVLAGADYVNAGANFPDGTLAAPSITFDQDNDTGYYRSGSGAVSFAANGVAAGTWSSAGVTAPALIPTGSSVPANGVYLPSTNNVAISTNAVQRLLINSGGITSANGGVFQGDVFSYATNGLALTFNSNNSEIRACRSGGNYSSMLFYTPGANSSGAQQERMRITSEGLVGIGTTAPQAKLHINNGTNENVRFATGGSGDQRIQALNDAGDTSVQLSLQASPLLFRGAGGTEIGRWDTSGRFLVGTSTARSLYSNTVATALQVEGTSFASSSASIVANGAAGVDTPRALFVLGRTRGAIGSNTVVASGDVIGDVVFQAADGSQMLSAAHIRAEVDGTPGANDMPGRLVFSTTADGASSPTERMRITNGGNILINATSVVNQGLVLISYSGAVNQGAIFADSSTASGNAAIVFRVAGTTVGSVTTTSSSTAYNISSDYRLKENIVPLTGAMDRLQQIPVHRFNFIADPNKTVDGFIAHEAQEIVPECVTGEKDAVDDDGNPVYQGIDQSKLVPLLTAALQEAIVEIASLKDRVAALEAQ